jgi:hypothetical protein
MEFNETTHLKGEQMSAQLGKEYHVRVPEHIGLGNAGLLDTLDPATVVLAVWEGWAEGDQRLLAQVFNRSTTPRVLVAVVSSRRLGRKSAGAHFAELGFQGLGEAVHQREVMCGSTTLASYTFRMASARATRGTHANNKTIQGHRFGQ